MSHESVIEVYLQEQRLLLSQGQKIVLEAPVSLAIKGFGEQMGSGCTPRGWHQIRARIGADCPVNTVFVGRRPTGEIYTPQLGQAFPGRDWILTRILWLSGLERDKNRLGRVDTMRRYIYIHGAPDETPMGIPGSHGCVRMHNGPLLELFARVKPGIRVLLVESSP